MARRKQPAPWTPERFAEAWTVFEGISDKLREIQSSVKLDARTSSKLRKVKSWLTKAAEVAIALGIPGESGPLASDPPEPSQASRALTRRRWYEVGRTVKSLEVDSGIVCQIVQDRDGLAKQLDTALHMKWAISNFKFSLENIMYSQHPDWRTGGRVFFLDTDPEQLDDDVEPRPLAC